MRQEKGHELAWPQPWRAWSALGLLLAAYTLSFADRMILNLLIEPIKHTMNISDTQISLLVGFAFALFHITLGLPAGYLADRINRRNLIICGIVVWSAMTAGCGLAGTFGVLLFTRIGVAVGEAVLGPAAYSIFSDSFPPKKLGRAVSVYTLGVPLGSGAALILGGALAAILAKTPRLDFLIFEDLDSWRVMFLILGLIGAPVALSLLLIREPARRHFAPAHQSAKIRDTWAHLKRNRSTVLLMLAANACYLIALYAMMTWIPSFLIRTYSVTTAAAGTVYGLALGAGGFIGLLLGGAISDRLFARGRRDAHLRVTAIALSLAWPFMVCFPLASNATTAVALLIPAVIAMSVPMGTVMTAIQFMTPNAFKGQIAAFFLLCGNLPGMGLGPTVVALITDSIFGDPAALRYSLVIVPGIALPLSAILFFVSLRFYRNSVIVAS